MAIAEREAIASVGFPAISTGAFDYPEEDATEIAGETFREQLGALDEGEQVRIVLWGEGSFEGPRRAGEDELDAG